MLQLKIIEQHWFVLLIQSIGAIDVIVFRAITIGSGSLQSSCPSYGGNKNTAKSTSHISLYSKAHEAKAKAKGRNPQSQTQKRSFHHHRYGEK